MQWASGRLRRHLADAMAALRDGTAASLETAWCEYLQLDQQLAAHRALQHWLVRVAALPAVEAPVAEIEAACRFARRATNGRWQHCRVFVDSGVMPGWVLQRAGLLIYELAWSSRTRGNTLIEMVFLRRDDGRWRAELSFADAAAAPTPPPTQRRSAQDVAITLD